MQKNLYIYAYFLEFFALFVRIRPLRMHSLCTVINNYKYLLVTYLFCVYHRIYFPSVVPV